jgi:hypothetical protein
MYQSICFSGHFPSWNGSRFSVNNTVDSQKTCRSTGNMLFLSHYEIHRDAAQHAATLLTLIFKAYLKMFIAFFEQTRLKSDPCPE